MNRSRVFLGAGVALAVVAFVAVLAFGATGTNNQQPPAPVAVVVAAQDIALGTLVAAAMLTTQNLAPEQAAGTYSSADQVVGAVARRAISHGQVIHTSDFQAGGAGATNVTASLAAGLRAIALLLDKAAAVDYLVQPGDYVDVMISFEDKDGTNPVVAVNPRYNQPVSGPDGTTTDTTPYLKLNEYLNSTTVKVLVQNVQVLAVEQEAATSVPTNVVPAAGAAKVPDFICVLAVNPQQAELLRYAQLDGNVSLVLRSPADHGSADVPTTGITLHELVAKWGVLPPVPVVP